MNNSSRETPEAGKESMEDRRDGGDRSTGEMAYADESGEEANISRVPGGLRESRFRKNCAEFTQPLVTISSPQDSLRVRLHPRSLPDAETVIGVPIMTDDSDEEEDDRGNDEDDDFVGMEVIKFVSERSECYLP